MNKKQTEKTIFEKFIKTYPDSEKINLSTLKQYDPPKPDIEINLKNGGTIGFELTEIVDEGMMKRIKNLKKEKKRVGGIGNIEDPLKKRIESKFEKKYKTSYPIELIVYYNVHYENECNYICNEINNYIKSKIVTSPFQKVWVYSYFQDEILYCFEKST